MRTLAFAVKEARTTPSRIQISKLAGLLTLAGPPDSPEGQRAYFALRILFLNQRRLGSWDQTIKCIPLKKEAILHLALCVEEFNRVAGSTALATAPIKLDKVVSVMLEVSNPKVYVQEAARNNFLKPSALWHPNSLAAAQKRMKGALGALSRDRADKPIIPVVED